MFSCDLQEFYGIFGVRSGGVWVSDRPHKSRLAFFDIGRSYSGYDVICKMRSCVPRTRCRKGQGVKKSREGGGALQRLITRYRYTRIKSFVCRSGLSRDHTPAYNFESGSQSCFQAIHASIWRKQ